MSGGCLDGVCGCLTVSGSYLGVSGRCLGEYRCHINHKQLNRSRYTKLLSFLPVTSCSQIGAKWQFHTFDWSWGFFWSQVADFCSKWLVLVHYKGLGGWHCQILISPIYQYTLLSKSGLVRRWQAYQVLFIHFRLINNHVVRLSDYNSHHVLMVHFHILIAQSWPASEKKKPTRCLRIKYQPPQVRRQPALVHAGLNLARQHSTRNGSESQIYI